MIPEPKRRHGKAGDGEDPQGKSTQGSCRRAESIPSGMPSITARTIAITESSRLNSNRIAISCAMGRPVHIETPKSPRINPHIQLPNCTHRGLSNPRSWRSFWRVLGNHGPLPDIFQLHDVARDDPHQEENDHRHAKQGRDHQQYPSYYVLAQHSSTFIPCLTIHRPSPGSGSGWATPSSPSFWMNGGRFAAPTGAEIHKPFHPKPAWNWVQNFLRS